MQIRKILLLGKNGQVGWELQRTLAPLGEIIAPGREEVDLLDEKAIRSIVRTIKPCLIVNAAAYNAVDKAEAEPELAMAVNGIAPGILAEEGARCKAALVHYSTDYLFDGTKKAPYTENDQPNPLNIYGQTKLAGERAIREAEVPHLIFRTSWVYGLRGINFLLTVLRLVRERDELRIVNDQHGSPTWCRLVAGATALVLARGTEDIYKYASVNSGIYNLSAAGQTTWFQFAEKILKCYSVAQSCKCRIIPISTGEYQSPARRPGFSVLDNSNLYNQFGIRLPCWENNLELAFRGLNPDFEPQYGSEIK